MKPLTPAQAAEFIATWNAQAIRRSGGIVLCPNGQGLDEHTREQIQAARAAGHSVQFVTGRAELDERLRDSFRPEPHNSDRGGGVTADERHG